ncbi:MAG: cupin domain-containing protein [Armatimonadetes bacterium]|nr:cupin domain-containing protein [Armatimonadota bacterium]
MAEILISPFDPQRLQSAHNNTILAHAGLPEHTALKIGTAWGCLKPGMAQEELSEPSIAKIYVAIQGAIRIHADGKPYELHAGEACFFPPGITHRVEQIGTQDYVGFAIWWEVNHLVG